MDNAKEGWLMGKHLGTAEGKETPGQLGDPTAWIEATCI